MEKYNDYKDSGIAWLGDIPEHWVVKRIKDTGVVQNGFAFKSYSFRNKGIRVLKITNIQPMNIDFSDESFVDDSLFFDLKSFRVLKGDIVFALTRPIISKGIKVAIVKNEEKLLLNQRNAVFRAKKNIVKGYFYFVLLSNSFIDSFDNYIDKTGTQPNISATKISWINIQIPPLKEQTQIANYLDAKTKTIDKKIKLLKQKIKHYKAYRKTLINETVTKGLDRTVKLKECDINWLKEIPEHWEIKRVKDIFSISRGRAIAKTELKDDGKYPVYSSQTKNKGVLGYIDTFDFNTDLLTWTTDGVNAGTVFIREGKFNCTNICGTLIPKRHPKLSLEYMAFAVQESTQHNKRIDTNGAKIMSNEMAVINIVFPPIEEQIKIANYIKTKTTTIDNIVSNIETQITTLKELRKTLINEVVTGKVKVTA